MESASDDGDCDDGGDDSFESFVDAKRKQEVDIPLRLVTLSSIKRSLFLSEICPFWP